MSHLWSISEKKNVTKTDWKISPSSYSYPLNDGCFPSQSATINTLRDRFSYIRSSWQNGWSKTLTCCIHVSASVAICDIFITSRISRSKQSEREFLKHKKTISPPKLKSILRDDKHVKAHAGKYQGGQLDHCEKQHFLYHVRPSMLKWQN